MTTMHLLLLDQTVGSGERGEKLMWAVGECGRGEYVGMYGCVWGDVGSEEGRRPC